MAAFYKLNILSSLFLIFHCCSVFGQAPDTLPVVVHVIHTDTPVGSAGNPSDAQIHAMITLVNNAFKKNGPFFGGAVVPYVLQLSKRGPNCGTTNGINRVNGSSVPKYATEGITIDTNFFPNSAHELFVKALSRWSNTDYINIWIVNMIDGNPSGTAGYAYFPQYNSALTDGLVIRADVVNGTDKVIVHEFGHFFNLDHTFGTAWSGCETETNCATHGDHICDTENCMFTFDCSSTLNPCTGNNYLIADPAFNYTVLNNYMGYTNCQWMFTLQQKNEMVDATESFRPGLMSSLATYNGNGNMPVAACIPTAVNGLSPYYGIERVEFGSMNVYSNASLPDGNFYIDRSCNQQIIVHAGDIVPVTVTGSYENFQHIRVFVDYNNNGVFNLPGELIMSGDGGSLSANISIPSSAVFCKPLRLRVVTDHPSAPVPTACMLTGTAGEGVGQVEDFAVIIKPRTIQSVASGN
ncbi:MAG TPA: M43 family zinc metalloprotease [Saprospiraceae bacterium]|nr:M43 family zinc metalloprotease [Saprospiraceae bacterium]